jgi:hypothetical protein
MASWVPSATDRLFQLLVSLGIKLARWLRWGDGLHQLHHLLVDCNDAGWRPRLCMFGEVRLSYLTAVTIATFVGMLICVTACG